MDAFGDFSGAVPAWTPLPTDGPTTSWDLPPKGMGWEQPPSGMASGSLVISSMSTGGGAVRGSFADMRLNGLSNAAFGASRN